MATSTSDDGDMPPPSKRRRTESITSNATQHREVGVMRQDTGRGASFVGSASGIHFVRSVYNAVGQASPGDVPSERQELVPGEEDQLPKDDANERGGDKLWRAGEISPSVRGQVVSLEELVGWSHSYFDHWHPVLPYLHAPSFLDWCEILSQRPLQDASKHLSPHQMVIVRAVFSTSLMDCRQMNAAPVRDAIPAALVFDSFYDAVTSVQAALVAAPSIESLQAAVSVQLFLISMLRHNAASRIGGIILRLLFQMGMHRCPYRYAAFSQHDCVLRQRVFWSVYCLDRYICQSLGIPLTLRDDDVDVCMPDREEHARDDEPRHAMDSRLTLLCLCARHSGIKGRVLELCNKSINYRQLDMDEVHAVRTEIAKWTNNVESTLDSYERSGASSSFDPLHSLILDVLKHESIIALNRPLLTGERPSEGYDSALQACISSSRSIIKSLARHAGSAPLAWPSFTWAAWMSGFIVLYAAVEGELPTAAAMALVDQCTSILDQLSERGTIWPKTCAKVVRDLAERVRQSSDPSRSNSSGAASSEQAVGADVMDPPLPAVEVHGAAQQTSALDDWRDHGGFPQDFFTQALDPGIEGVDLFRGFDIPFWLGDDQYAGMMNEGWM